MIIINDCSQLYKLLSGNTINFFFKTYIIEVVPTHLLSYTISFFYSVTWFLRFFPPMCWEA